MLKLTKLKKIIIAVLATLLVAGGAGTWAVLNQRATFTIVDGDSTTEVTTWEGKVTDILATAKIELGQYDTVEPARDTALDGNTRIEISRASAYNATVDGKTEKIWSTAKNWLEILNTANAKQVSFNLPRNSATPLQATNGKIPVTADGKTTEVEVAATATIQNLLETAKLQLSPIDELSLTLADGKLGLKVIRVTRGNVTEEIETPFETEYRDNAQLFKGQERVVTEGVNGITKVTYYRYVKDGETLVNKEISRTEATAKVNQVIEKGTAERPLENQNPTPVQNQAAPAPVTGDVWAALAQCESGGNPAANTGNGYYGMYQFSLPTWQAVGGTGLPSENSAAEQTLRAQILQARAGWGQWPACARRIGLL